MPLPRFAALCVALVSLVSAGLAQSSLNLSTDLVRLGIAAANMTPNQTTLDAGPLLESGIKYAATHQIPLVVATAGSYYFLSGSASNANTHVLINGLSFALTVDLQGSDLYFSHPEKFGLFLTGLTNVTLQNFTMDYLQQRYTQLTVTSVNAATGQIQYSVQPGWQTPTALATLNSVFVTSGAAPTFAYVFRNGQPIPSFARLIVATPFTDTSMTLTSANPAATISSIRVGDVVVLTLRAGGNAVLATNLTGCTLRNIKIYSGFVGLRSLSTTSTTLEHVEVIPRPSTDRMISTVGDGISPSQPGLNNVIRLSRVIRSLDDGFSPNTYVFGSVQSVTGTRVAQLQGDADTAFNGGTTLPNGSTVAFERATDGTILGSAVVVSQTTAAAIGGLPQLVVTFDRDLPANIAGTWAYPTDASWRGGSLLMERNAVENQGWARGISLWGLVSPTLRGNYLHRTPMAAIAVMHQLFTGDWHVPPVTNLTLSNNVIDGTVNSPDINTLIELGAVESIATASTFAPMTGAPHQNLIATTNFLADTGRTALWIGNVTGGTVDGNYILNPNTRPNLSLAYGPYQAQELQPIVAAATQGALNFGSNPVDEVSGRAFVTDPSYTELAAYAPGATVRLTALNLPGLTSGAAITLTDADGKIWTLSGAAQGANSLDVALPAGAGLGGAVIAVKATQRSYFGTLFIDSQDTIAALNQPTYLISAGSLSAPAQQTSLSFLVTTNSTSPFTVTDADSFVSSSNSVNGPGSSPVTVTLAPNTGSARSTTVEIAGQPFVITQAGASDPTVVSAPSSQTVASGASTTLNVTTSGGQSYQWLLNGAPIAGATGSTYTIPAATTVNAGTYAVKITNASGSVTTAGALVTVSPPAVGRLVNLSILTNLSATSPMLTMGTVVGGTGTSGNLSLLIRGAGPALATFGLSGVLADPQLTLYSGSTAIGSNDNWSGTTALSTVFAAVGAFPYASADSKDAAVYNQSMSSGLYSVQVSGVAGATGQVIAELYDSTPTSQFAGLAPRLINVSVLKTLAAGETLTAGFVIGGNAAKQVLIRADGPALALAPFNLSGTMSDPMITLYGAGSVVIASNDNWGAPVGSSAASAADLSAAFSAVGAFGLPSGSKDSALLVTLAPGSYSAAVTGVNQTGGQVIVEVYEVK